MVKVLITSAGGVNGINVIKALKRQKEIKISILSTDTQPLNASRYLSDKFYTMPPADSPFFVNSLIKICKKEKINIVLPMYSAEILTFSKNKNLLDKNGIKMAIPPYETVEISWDKYKTLDFFEKNEIPYPKTYSQKELTQRKAKLPLFIKQVKGSGSHDAHILKGWREVDYHRQNFKNSIIQEYIKGNEYTIDALGDLDGKMIAASPRKRLEVKGGLAIKSITVRNKILTNYAKLIIEKLNIIGPVNIQCIMKRNKPYFIEINTRFPSGGLPLAVVSGFNIPLLVIKMLLRKPPGKTRIRNGLVMLRYWDALFVKPKGKSYSLYDFYHEFK